jgi:flagellar protein FliS
MAPPRGAEAYKRIEAESRSPMELVVMLYDGAIRFLGEARTAHTKGDLAARGTAVGKALDIVAELQNTLNVADGGTIAEELDRLYTFSTTRLLDVTLKQDLTALDDVEKVLVTLREGWAQISATVPKP